MLISYTTGVINKKSTTCETKLFIDVIIHKSSIIVIKILTNLINNCLKLWIDQKFVKLSAKNWMRISLRTDREKSIKEKVKISFLNMKNKAIVDETSDDF